MNNLEWVQLQYRSENAFSRKCSVLFLLVLCVKQGFQFWRNMFSGIQEILVLLAIIVGIIFLPRILNRGQENKVAATKPKVVLSGKMRLAIAASVLWPAVMAAYMQPWKHDLFPFLYIGLGPVAVGWILYWIFTGFRKK